MIQPIIGITCDLYDSLESDTAIGAEYKLRENYCLRVLKAGGVPVIIPPCTDMKTVAEFIDGWLIPGGKDIDAAKYHEQNHEMSDLQNPQRWEGEKALYDAVDPNMPILGICYGCQFMNVAEGGSMIQHLPDSLGNHVHEGGTLQTYKVAPDSKTAQMMGVVQAHGKSYHHQAIGEIGRGLRIVSKHEDGTVEAVESTERPWVIGVQWHPERTPDEPASQNLFASFISAARDFRIARLAKVAK